MSKPVKYSLTALFILTILLILLFPLTLGNRRISWSPAVKVDGILYVSTGNPIEDAIPEEDIAGRTKTYTDQLPRRNGQSNILSENGLAYAPWEDGLAVEVDGEWIFFKKSENN